MSFSADTNKYISSFWQQKIDDIKASIKKAAPKGTGMTAQEVDLVEVVGNKTYVIKVVMPDYYQYIDEGVVGTKSMASNSTGRFRFNRSNRMVNLGAIRDFMLTRGIVDSGYRQNKKIKNPTLKKKAINKGLDSLAVAIATSIHQQGIDRTNFYSDNVDAKAIKEFQEGLATSVKNVFIKSITKNGDKITVNKLF